jgi:hypothetical protein
MLRKEPVIVTATQKTSPSKFFFLPLHHDLTVKTSVTLLAGG